VDTFFEENKEWHGFDVFAVEVYFVQAKTMMKLDYLLTSYLLQDNILVLNTNLTTSFGGIIFQQIFYHDLKVDKWNKYKTNKNFV